MSPDATDPMSAQTQYLSTNATSAVTVASPALHNYSTVSNHPYTALSTRHHSQPPELTGYDTSQWYGYHPPLTPFEMPQTSWYPYVPNASGRCMPQGYPTASYGPQYPEHRYLPPGVVPPTCGYMSHDYHNAPADWHHQTNPYPTPNSMTMMPIPYRIVPHNTYGYSPQHPVVNTLYGNVGNVHNPPHTRLTALAQFRGQSSDTPINTSHRPPPQRETVPPAAIATILPYNSSIRGSNVLRPLEHFCQSEEDNRANFQENVLPTTPLYNDSLSPAAKRLRLTDSLEQSESAVSGTSSHVTQNISGQIYSQQFFRQFPDLSEDSFAFLYERLHSICSKWYNFGLALGLQPATLNQISNDKREKCEDCLRESLLKLVQIRRLTWREIIEALKKPTVNESELATEIESEAIARDPPTQAPNSVLGKLSLEELCFLPVNKVCYQLGLWLGIEERRLIEIKKEDEKRKLLFAAFLELPFVSTAYKHLCLSFTESDGQQEKARRLLETERYEDFIKLFPSDKQIEAKKIVVISTSLSMRLITTLIKVGKRDVADNICSKRG